MMLLVLAFYEKSREALEQGAQINDLVKMDVREKIGRYKYTEEQNLTSEYEAVSNALAAEIANVLGKGDQ